MAFSLASKAVVAKTCKVNKRVQVVAHADRRAVLGGVLAGVVAMVADKAEAGVTNVDLFDDRAAKAKGFDIIYEARDLDLPQGERDGITQFRTDVKATKARLDESSRRINEELGAMIEKSYWTPAREELRRQLGNMRQDINTLASNKGSKDLKKAALAQSKTFITDAEKLDFAIRQKNAADVQKAYAQLKSSLASLRSTLA